MAAAPRHPWAALSGEAAGSFLVLAGGGAVARGLPGVAGAAFGYGAAVAVGVALFGKASRAHFNPAVTAAFLATGRIRWPLALGYVVAQVAGFLAAAALLDAVDAGSADVVQAGGARSWVGEAAAAFLLMGVIAWAAWTPRARWIPPLAIGGAVAASVLLFAGLSGAGMNPARSLGPWLLSGRGPGVVPYLVGPFIGALAAAGVHWLAARSRTARAAPRVAGMPSTLRHTTPSADAAAKDEPMREASA